MLSWFAQLYFVSVLAGRALLDKHRFPWGWVLLGVQEEGVGENIKTCDLLEAQRMRWFKAMAVKFMSAGRDLHGVCNGFLKDVWLHHKGEADFSGNCWREGITAWLESHTAALKFPFSVPGCPEPAVFGGEAVRGLELGAVLNCPSWPNVSSFCRCGPCWGGSLSCPGGCRLRAALCCLAAAQAALL